MDYWGPGLKETALPDGGNTPPGTPADSSGTQLRLLEGHCAPFCRVLRSPRL